MGEEIPQCRLLGQLTVVEAEVVAKQLPYWGTEAETEAGDKYCFTVLLVGTESSLFFHRFALTTTRVFTCMYMYCALLMFVHKYEAHVHSEREYYTMCASTYSCTSM